MSSSPTALLNHQPIIQFFHSSSHCKLKSVKPFSVGPFPTSNALNSCRMFVSGGTVSRKTGGTKASALRDRDGDEDGGPAEARLGAFSAFRDRFMAQDAEATLNQISKWIIAAIFGATILCRHDKVAAWSAGGAVLNNFISLILKRILNQERPDANLRSDPGMPSSHAQNIFYIFTFAVISILELLGMNGNTLLASVVILSLASYLTWLRVSQQLHTVSQITVGAVLGTVMGIWWYWSWHAIVKQVFESMWWVRALVVLGVAAACLNFIAQVTIEWFRDE